MTDARARATETLVPIVEKLCATHADALEHHKEGRKHLHADDFIWRRLLVAMSTMGNSRGWDGLIGDESNYRLVAFDALADLDPADRLDHLKTVLRRAKVRMPDQKSEWLAENYERIVAMGGLDTVNQRFQNMRDRDEIIAFLRSFAGIGPKYARNIPMDVYHPAFRDSIAVDERIENVSEALGLSFSSFDEHEDFYLGVAKRAGIEGWELDRLLYNFNDEVLARVVQHQEVARGRSARDPEHHSPRVDTERTRDEANSRRSYSMSEERMPESSGNVDRQNLFEAVQQAFNDEFPDVRAYTRANGWFYGSGTHVFFVAKPGARGRGVQIRLHASKEHLPDTDLELVEKPHSGRADPPVQFLTIDSLGEVPEVMRLARFAYRNWGSA